MFKKFIKSCLLAGMICSFAFYTHNSNFKTEQLKSPRVKAAYEARWPAIERALTAMHIGSSSFDIYLRVLKSEGLLELWLKNTTDKEYRLFKTMAVCAKSGQPGPKRRQGDGQVPEGFYSISAFNPASSYHLSLKVSYPNKSDVIRSKSDPGGDIMIHGNCVTIGCIPIQNGPVEELYLLCMEARNRSRSINVDIYPCRLSGEAATWPCQSTDPALLKFWGSLQKAYVYFEKNHSQAHVTVDKAGNYLTDASSHDL